MTIASDRLSQEGRPLLSISHREGVLRNLLLGAADLVQQHRHGIAGPGGKRVGGLGG